MKQVSVVSALEVCFGGAPDGRMVTKIRLACGGSVTRRFQAKLLTRPAVVQTAKTFELMRNNDVKASCFPQSFPQLSRKSSQG
jgi:hypothetical protein